MVDKELLSAMSVLLDQKLDEKLDKKLDEKLDQKFDEKLKPICDRMEKLESDMKYVRVVQLENTVIPRLDRMESRFDRMELRTEKLESDMKYVRVVQLENTVIPRLDQIESCYLDTSRRYSDSIDHIDKMSSDIDVLKSVVKSHSEQLNQMLA